MKRLAPLAASIMAGLASASGAAICSPTSPQPDRRVCDERLLRSEWMPGPALRHFDTGAPDWAHELPDWRARRVLVPARQLVLLHETGYRRQASDPEPTPVHPVELSDEPMGSLPVVAPAHERPARRGAFPLMWALAIATIMGLVFLSYVPL